MIFNKHVVTKGKVVLYGDSNYLDTYSNTTRLALDHTKNHGSQT